MARQAKFKFLWIMPHIFFLISLKQIKKIRRSILFPCLTHPQIYDRPTISFLPHGGVPLAAIQSIAAISRRRRSLQCKTTIFIIGSFRVSYITSNNTNFIMNCLVTFGTEIEIAGQ
jgi:hypothetical protein